MTHPTSTSDPRQHPQWSALVASIRDGREAGWHGPIYRRVQRLSAQVAADTGQPASRVLGTAGLDAAR